MAGAAADCPSHVDAWPVTTYTAREPFNASISQLSFSTP
jgi:hypothetical protein